MSTSKKLTTAPKFELLSIETLASEIRTCAETIASGTSCARESAFRAMEAAASAGARLIHIKQMLGKRGEFGTWLSANLPEISHETCNRYMRVARAVAANPALLSDKHSLQSIYVALDILPAPPAGASGGPALIAWERPMQSFESWLRKATPEDLTPDTRMDLIKRLEGWIGQLRGGPTQAQLT